MCSLGLGLIMWLDFNKHIVSTQSKWNTKMVRLGLLLVALTFGITIGYSRLFLGVHSIDQVIYGWNIGLWYAFTFHFLIGEPLTISAKDLLEVRDTKYTARSIECTLALVAAMALQIANYAVVTPKVVIDPSWPINMEAKCGSLNLSAAFTELSLN